MARYLVQASYTPAAWAAMVDHPEDRSQPVRRMVEHAGGHLECFYLAFGDYDVVAIVDLPDDVAAATVSIAASAGGGIKGIKTTPLLSGAETVEALGRVRGVEYAPPGDAVEIHTPIPAG
jgi:uncharacterized protein with GYD domain